MPRWLLPLVICSGCSPLIYVAMGGAPDEAPPIALATAVHGTTLGAHDDYDPRCAGDVRANDAAYTLRVPRTGRYGIRARATFDVVLAIYEGEALLACNDDHDDESVARLVAELEAGVTYTVVIDGWGGAAGDYVLAVDPRREPDAPGGPPPRNGDPPPTEDAAALRTRCASAEPLRVGATEGVLIPTDAHAVTRCGAGGRGPEAIYRLALDAPVELSVQVTSEVDTIVELRRGCGETSEVIACVDDAPDERHTGLTARLEAGEYFLLVDSYAPDVGGAFHLEVEMRDEAEPPESTP